MLWRQYFNHLYPKLIHIWRPIIDSKLTYITLDFASHIIISFVISTLLLTSDSSVVIQYPLSHSTVHMKPKLVRQNWEKKLNFQYMSWAQSLNLPLIQKTGLGPSQIMLTQRSCCASHKISVPMNHLALPFKWHIHKTQYHIN